MATYAGIGSRETPWQVCDLMEQLAQRLACDGYTLRSGAAKGADEAFGLGAKSLELFLPWDGYNCSGGYPEPKPEAYELSAIYHPNWGACSAGARALHARNAHIVFGWNLDDPVEFVLCWTRDGAVSETTSKTGGTGQAIRIASAFGIPVFNLARPEHLELWTKQRYVL